MAGLLLLAAAPTGPTGRALIGTSAQEPGIFKNFLQNAVQLGCGDATYNYPPLFDANGLPKNATLTQVVYYTCRIPSNVTTGTEMTLSGTGQILRSDGFGGLGIGTSTTVVADPDNVVVQDPNNSLQIRTTGGITKWKVRFKFNSLVEFNVTFGDQFSNFQNLVLCRSSDWASLVDGSTYVINTASPIAAFTQEYIDNYKALNPKILRPMGWSSPNDGSNFTRHEHRLPWQTGLGMGGARVWKPECLAGDNGSGATIITGTNTYAAAASTATPGSYTHGEVIQGQFANANSSSSATLNVGGRGAKAIKTIYGAATLATSQVGNNPDHINANSLATLFFDSLHDAWIYCPYGMTCSFPIEMEVAFANAINAHLWHVFPGHTVDASYTSVVQYVRDNLASQLTAYFERDNEVWNDQFEQTSFAGNSGALLDFPSGDNRQRYGYYALKIAQQFPLISAAWSPRNSSQLKRVMAFQAYGDTTATDLYRLKGADLRVSFGYSGYNSKINQDFYVAPNRPIDLCEVISYATYYSGGELMQFDKNYTDAFDAGLNFNALVQAGDDYASGSTAAALSWLDGDIRTGSQSNGNKNSTQTLQDLNGTSGAGNNIYGGWETIAASYTGKTVECYEGGFGGIAPSEATLTYMGVSSPATRATRLANLVAAYKRSQLFYDTSLLQYQNFMSRAHSVTPAWLLIPGPNAWGLKDSDSVSNVTLKSWDMNVDYNHGIG